MIDSSTNLANTSSNKPHNYHEQSQIDQTLRLREVLKTLPPFVKDYFRAMEPKSSARTRLRNRTGKRQISVRYHSLTCNTAALSKGAYRGKKT